VYVGVYEAGGNEGAVDIVHADISSKVALFKPPLREDIGDLTILDQHSAMIHRGKTRQNRSVIKTNGTHKVLHVQLYIKLAAFKGNLVVRRSASVSTPASGPAYTAQMNVVGQVSVLFFLMMIGWVARKVKALDDLAISRFSAFVVNIALPALIFISLQRSFSPDLLGEAGIILVLSLAMYALTFALAFFYPTLIGAKGKERGVHRYALIFSNVGFMGYPVVEAVLGKEALFHLAVYNVPFNLLAFSIGAWLIAREGNKKIHLSWRLMANPSVIATLVGFIFFLFSFRLPAPLLRTVEMTGNITSPLSMIVTGALLARMDPRSILGRWRTYITTFMRLVLLPLLTCVALYAIGMQGLLLSLPVLIAAMPVAANTTLLANLYDGDVENSGAMVFISTVACIITIPFAVLLPGYF
jgi:predicted permease